TSGSLRYTIATMRIAMKTGAVNSDPPHSGNTRLPVIPVTVLYATHGLNACGLVRLAIADAGPAGADGSRTSEIKNGTCSTINTAATMAMPFSRRVTPAASNSGAATNIPDRCDCTAIQASAPVMATRELVAPTPLCGVGGPMVNALAIAILMNAA